MTWKIVASTVAVAVLAAFLVGVKHDDQVRYNRHGEFWRTPACAVDRYGEPVVPAGSECRFREGTDEWTVYGGVWDER